MMSAEDENRLNRESSRVWDEFCGRVAGLATLEEASAFLAKMPPRTSPDFGFHVNFANFLLMLAAPKSATTAERDLYAQFIERVDAAGRMKRSTAAKIIAALRRPITS
ncbi:hypothetical protein [Limnoglobus roseus]|uniref:Uncharacterized protein n=1 Tax=Limnoglobus roseus TaxID=2598579 RepID=A0A5C1ACI7_9BACT|nr:hypothetical protein [Limnoglobus roseus]QEL15482.1 hypothetical protein PX52LOC_02405 [Limnoglobus roseus]